MDREQEQEKQSRLAEQPEADIRKLRSLEQVAIQPGRKLGPRDRLKAAFHLTRAWKRANRKGLRKEDFQDMIFERLQKPHEKRQEFRLTNWTLRRGEDPMSEDLTEKYGKSRTPHKALEPYFVAIAVAAEHCGVNPDDWKLAMVRDLSIWSQPTAQLGVTPPDDRPAETLAILLNALCSSLGQRHRLMETFDAIRRMNCRWEMFNERLVPTEQTCMMRIESPISPMYEDCIYFEEMFPFPSVPLLRVPYALGKAIYGLAPEDQLRALDERHLSSGAYFDVGLPFKVQSPLESGEHYNIPDDAPGQEIAEGDFVWFREIRLCIVPDGRDGFTSALETRPYMKVRFDEEHPFAGRHHVLNGYEIDLERGLFYGRSEDGGHLFPTICGEDGREWRLKVLTHPEDGLQITELTQRGPEPMGWYFEPDPVSHPGAVSNEPWYLSYTPASSPYLRYWLTHSWGLAGAWADCPWDSRLATWSQPDNKWTRDVPPIHELNFPDSSHATWIECCLHNGLLEEALEAAIVSLKGQTARLQSDWHTARERHSNALLRRWKTEDTQQDTQQ